MIVNMQILCQDNIQKKKGYVTEEKKEKKKKNKKGNLHTKCQHE